MFSAAMTMNPALWKPSDESRKVITVLSDSGKSDPQVLFVGGVVRNALLQKPPGDADLATVHTPVEVTQRLEGAGIKVVPTGIDHGTVTAVVNGVPFEITTLRCDIETDGRHAVVAYTDNWLEDARRRDFTINTLLADLDGHVYDPTGQGVKDLQARRIVFVGEPELRIAEDYLRILRFFRFQALYGDGVADAKALAACKAAADKISTLSRERITQETLKILSVDNPAGILEMIRDNNVMTDLFDPECNLFSLNVLTELQKFYAVPLIESLLVLLCAGHHDHLQIVEKYLLFSNAQKKNLESLFRAIASIADPLERLFRFGREVGVQSLLIRAVINNVRVDAREIQLIKTATVPVMPLTGSDLMALGFPEGPRLGEVLNNVRSWWIAEKFKPGYDECLSRAKSLI